MRTRTGEPALDPRSQPAAAPDGVDAALASAGDRSAFERLYRRHVGRIHSLALRMIGPSEAEEVTQEVFVRAWTKLPSFRGEAAFGTWLYRMGINTILTSRVGLGRRRSREVESAELPLQQAPARTHHHELEVDLERSIQRLPERARVVFVLHDVEGFRHEEISDMLSINIGTSKSQLHRARMLLRELLRHRGRVRQERADGEKA